jgi:hypothetical protein
LTRPAAHNDGSPRRARPKATAKAAGLQERHVQETITQMLEWDGWRAIRTEHAIERDEEGNFKRRVGEVGMADMLFIRYEYEPCRGEECSGERCFPRDIGKAMVLWCEFKRPGGKLRPDQLAWHAAERARGALVLVIDSIEAGRAWYDQSGLRRR